VTLSVDAGESVGIAGESGCGKSTLTSTVLRLQPKSAVVTGQVRLDGEDVLGMSWGRVRAVRWAQASVVFQGAMHALNPVQRIGEQLAEPITAARPEGHDAEARRRVGELLEQVGLPARRAGNYPHQLSGGQKQRVMIAMALACGPRLVVADEPTTALDVMVQAQVLDVLSGLVRDLGLAWCFISHDLSVLSSSLRPHRGHVRRAHRRGRPGERGLRPALAPLRRGAGRRVPADRRHPVPLCASRAAGRPAVPRRPAERLRLPSPLPGRHGRLLGHGAAAAHARGPAYGACACRGEHPMNAERVRPRCRRRWRHGTSR
jgi:ABC-type dipeptide/oligopeptide/nickel transport system ATPase subunit